MRESRYESFVVAARLPAVDRDQAAAVGLAEGRAAVALLGQLGDEDWTRPTDCTEWNVRAVVSHLVAQCEDAASILTLLRRELVGRRRYPERSGADAHMAAQVDDHRDDPGPALVDRFSALWPRAVQVRRRRPLPVRRLPIDLGVPGLPRVPFSYLIDVIYNRDLWMHRLDLARATGRTFTVGEHDRHIVAPVVRDLALAWRAEPVALELTGPAGGSWIVGSGPPTATIRADAVAFLRALAGRDDNVELELVSGDGSAVRAVHRARVVF